MKNRIFDIRSSSVDSINRSNTKRIIILGLIAGAIAAVLILPQLFRSESAAKKPTPQYISLVEVKGMIEAHKDTPSELRSLSHEELVITWPAWIAQRDAQVRARVAKGEEDSLANLLLNGTSFTKIPQITDLYRADLIHQLGSEEAADRHIRDAITSRSIDLAHALSAPGEDERRLIMLDVANGIGGSAAKTQEDQQKLAQCLFDNLVRYLNQEHAYAKKVSAVQTTTPSDVSISLANLYQTRGLSTDTSILVDYALAQALQNLHNENLLRTGSVRHVGVIGPGLDLIDKNGGYDLHPPQSTQPFILMDTLLNLNLANKEDLRMSTFDISPRVNQHLERAVKKARDNQPYIMHLVHNDSWGWSAEAVNFWEQCGSQILKGVTSLSQRNFSGVTTRTIQVHPNWPARIHPVDLNIVYQRLPLSTNEQFDLLIATNILCYYDSFEQSLSLYNAARMLRPGGILLSTEILPNFQDSNMLQTTSTPVTTSKSGGYTIFCYQRSSSNL